MGVWGSQKGSDDEEENDNKIQIKKKNSLQHVGNITSINKLLYKLV